MIKSIRAKLAAGDRLGRADALYLLESPTSWNWASWRPGPASSATPIRW